MSNLNSNINMSSEFDAPKFDQNQAEQYLDALYQLTSSELGMLSGGTPQQLPKGLAIVESLRRSSISFGDPRNELIQLNEETFKDSGTELTNLYKQQMQTQFDFYYMTLTVDMLPQPGAQFRRLTCELDFSPKGANQPIVQTIFPNQQWREVLSFGVGMKVGLNGNLDWSAGVSSEQLAQVIGLLPGDLKTNVSNTNEFSGVVAIPEYKYSLGQTEITALGQGNSTCYWRLQNQELQRIGTAKFITVFKVPKGAVTITLKGLVWAEPDMNWLTADIKDVFSELMHRTRSISRNKEEAASQFARGASEEWQLNLPRDMAEIN
jgi:hypothetical protein